MHIPGTLSILFGLLYIDSQGLHPLPEKVRAIQDAPMPSNVIGLKSFLGLLQYYSKFLPNQSIVLALLYRLLRRRCERKWAKPEAEVFAEAKKLLMSSQLLVHYDPALPLILATKPEEEAFAEAKKLLMSSQLLVNSL